MKMNAVILRQKGAMMRKRRKKSFPWKQIMLFLLVLVVLAAGYRVIFHGNGSRMSGDISTTENTDDGDGDSIFDSAKELFSLEPKEVQQLRKQEVAQTDGNHQEYYFKLLEEDEQRAYREMLAGIRAREDKFYLTIAADEKVDKVYHALLKDHPEIFWAHNRMQVYKTTYSDSEYCSFSPGYTYTEEETEEIQQAMEDAFAEVRSLIPEGADTYEQVKTVYTYVIDNVDYVSSEHDQSIAGSFWKKEAVCAGYAGAMQYLLERLGIFCIYVEGDAKGSDEGHAWNIVRIDGEYYYVDATNGDQPAFLEGDAVLMAEHKTTIYDYLCPFPEEYEATYTASDEFPVPECTATAKNFYVLNDGCFDTYDFQTLYEYCQMRLDNGAAVVRFKFSNGDAFTQAYEEWISGESVQEVARYYMKIYGLNEVEYHYGILENLKTMYFMF
jgi:hypothetical protein